MACGSDDQAALEELYKLTSAQLYGVLLRILKIEGIAEDALQETYIKIWNKAATYQLSRGTPMPWMYSIARHQALDILRRRSVREDQESGHLVALIDATPHTDKPVEDMAADAQALLLCLQRLKPEVQDCLVKAYCEGYSHNELSAAQAAPLGTIKSWIRRGLLSLRECLDEIS